LLHSALGIGGLFAAAVVLFLIGWWAAADYVAWSGEEDPSPIVVDEVVGQWLALLLADPERWWTWLLGFLAFRLFDILKPWPVNLADRSVGGGFGVMLDD